MALALRVASALLGGTLVAQAGGKWIDLAGYRAGLEAFELFPSAVISVVAVAWASVELVAGVLLLLAASRRLPEPALWTGLSAAMLIAMAYTVVNGVTWARGIPVGNCTCFGVFLPQRLGLSVMIQDVLVVAWAGWLAVGRQALLRH
jgi:hypothetical protein